MDETYKAQGYCTNCGRENYPQWGEYKKGTLIEDYPCPACGCMTWRPRVKTAAEETGLVSSNDT